MKVYTHSGEFRASEIIACAIISLLAEHRGERFEVVRTNDAGILSQAKKDPATPVVGVGGEYSEELSNFDPRYRGVDFKNHEYSGPLRTATGLVWLSFGEELPNVTPKVWEDLDGSFVAAVDAVDAAGDEAEGWNSPISAVLSGFNPPWEARCKKEEEASFLRALEVAKLVLKNQIQIAAAKISAERYVRGGMLLHGGKTLLLEQTVPWQHTVATYEEFAQVLFVLFPIKGNGWRIQAVSAQKLLPESWAGLSTEEELNDIIDIQDGVFCHHDRTIAGARSRGSIIRMADLANS